MQSIVGPSALAGTRFHAIPGGLDADTGSAPLAHPLIRHLIGDETADLLGVPESHLVKDVGRLTRVANWFFVHIFGRSDRDSARYELMSELARPFGHELLDGLFKLERGGERAPFDMPDHLARSWGLSA